MKNVSTIAIISIVVLILLGIFLYKGKDKEDNLLDREINIQAKETSTNINTDNQNKNTTMDNNQIQNYKEAVLHTNMGDITLSLSTDKPDTTSNFIKLASSGFYNGVKFHRVIKGFMIQTGDPLSKDDTKKDSWGTGGPGYKFADELTGKETYTVGTVAMANSGPNTNGSQFFIMTSDTPLPPSYTVFGKVILGQEVAQKIQEVKTGQSDRPLESIIINSVELK